MHGVIMEMITVQTGISTLGKTTSLGEGQTPANLS